jgi:predicted TIM-barrel fold metal-dependent hydrolase
MIPTDAIVSGDSHLEVPPDRWIKYVPEKFRELAPRIIEFEGAEAVAVPGYKPVFTSTNLTAGGTPVMKGATYWNDDGSPSTGAGGPAQRLAEQEQDGIAAEVLYAPLFMEKCVNGVEDKDAYVAMFSAYNEFLAEYCSYDPERLIGVGLIPKTGVQDAISELKHIDSLGLRAVSPRWFPNGGGRPHPDDDRFWEEALALGIRITPHCLLGGPPVIAQRQQPMPPMMLIGGAPQPPLGAEFRITARVGSSIPVTLAQFMVSGVLDRFPELMIYLAEVNAGYLPHSLSMMDDSYNLYGGFGVDLKMKPSEYALRHFIFGIIRDPVALAMTDLIPAENLIWGSDFPHAVGSWPHSTDWLDGAMSKRTDDERRLITRDNTLKFFGIERRAREAQEFKERKRKITNGFHKLP